MLISRFGRELTNIMAVPFAPYTYARNLYEHTINCIHVRDQLHQVDMSTKLDPVDSANTEYYALKKEGFPDAKFEAEV